MVRWKTLYFFLIVIPDVAEYHKVSKIGYLYEV